MSRPYQGNFNEKTGYQENFIEKKGHVENNAPDSFLETKEYQENGSKTFFEKKQSRDNGSNSFLKKKRNIFVLILSVILLFTIAFLFIFNKESRSRQAISNQTRRAVVGVKLPETKSLSSPYTCLESDYRIIMSDKSLEKISAYKTELEHNINLAGNRLKEIMSVQNGQPLRQMSVNKFVDALLGSKIPSVSADQQNYSPSSDWSAQDARALGEISIVMHVKIFDNGDWLNPKIHQNSFDGYLMFVPGALLISRCNVDYAEVFANGTLDKNAYFELYERRLLPLLRFANDESKAKNKKAVVTIPSIGCGKFSGGYNGIINVFNAMLEHLLQKYAPQLPNISLVYFAQFSDTAISEKTQIFHMKYHRVSNKHKNDYKQLLETPSSYSIDGEDYTDHLLFAFVAWDHLSYPGNNFFFSMPVRNSDDGVKAAATSSMTSLLGVDGFYDELDKKYKPVGVKQWLYIAETQRLKSQDRLFVLNTKKVDEIKLEQRK